MVCQACMERCSFLWAYAAQLAGTCFCEVDVTQICTCEMCVFNLGFLAAIFNWTLGRSRKHPAMSFFHTVLLDWVRTYQEQM